MSKSTKSVKPKQKAQKGSKRQAPGNTSSGAKEVRSLFFTLNNWTEGEKDSLLEWFKKRNMSYVMQAEIGEENGVPHLQGVWKCKNSIKFDWIKEKFPRVHWEKTKGWDWSINYCSKSRTSTGQGWKSDDVKITFKKPIKSPLDGKELYSYQKKILNLLKEEPDDRKIHWFYEEEGNVGKSALVKHIYLTFRDKVVIATGKGNDVRNQIN